LPIKSTQVDASRATASSQITPVIAPVVLFGLGFTILFHRWLFSGFDQIIGDREDGYIALALIEHWHHVFSGAAHWADPIFFFPQRSVLGYTDAYFLIGLVHAPLRLAGLDIFTAYMLAICSLAAIGFFSFRHLAHRHLSIPATYASIGAFLFAFGNIDAVKLIHVQSYCAMLLPSLCILTLSAFARASIARAILAGLLYAALFLTAFQTAWFFGCYILLLAGLFPLVMGLDQTRDLIGRLVGKQRALVLSGVAAFAVGMIPFVTLYLPVLAAGHSRDFAEVASNMPIWRDLANVTPENALWGQFLKWLEITGLPNRPVWEAELGFTPAVLTLFVVGNIVWWRRRPVEATNRLFILLGAAVIGMWLLQLEYGGFRPWRLIWAIMPGGGAIRYPFRSQLVANLLVCLVVARAFSSTVKWLSFAPLISLVLIAEQINRTWPPTFSRASALAFIGAAQPPADCRVFYIAPRTPERGPDSPEHQTAAMLLAEIRNIPTVNGDSSWTPEGWALDRPSAEDYPAKLRDWVLAHGVEQGICGFDLDSGRWTIGLPRVK